MSLPRSQKGAETAKLSPNEASFIFSVHKIRHNTNEVLLILPWLVALVFSMIGVPVIAVFCDLPLVWDIILFLEAFEKETRNCIRFSDVDEQGRIVNVRISARLKKAVRE